MAQSHGITREDIFAVADEIFATGKNPTQASVRAKLGRGSFSTISKYLSEWREKSQEDGLISSEVESIPDEVMALLRRFYGALRVSVESGTVSEQVELLEQENERLRENQANYDAIAAELAGLRFAYQEAMTRLDETIRENEQLKQAATKTSTRKPRTPKAATT